MQVYPVSPLLDEDGAIRALVPELGKEAATPPPQRKANGGWDIELEMREQDAQMSARLDIVGVMSAEAQYKSTTSILETMVGKNSVISPSEVTEETVIYEAFWGVGLRFALTYEAGRFGANPGFAEIAARAEAERVDVQYQMSAVGLGPKELALVLERVPPLGKLDMTMFARIEEVRGGLVAALIESLSPDHQRYPVLVKMARTPFDDDFEKAATFRALMTAVANSLSLAQALVMLESQWQIDDRDGFSKLYREFVGGVDNPERQLVTRAQRWLAYENLSL